MEKINLTSFYIFGYLLELRKKFGNLKQIKTFQENSMNKKLKKH
jgi:hypothetical protein